MMDETTKGRNDEQQPKCNDGLRGVPDCNGCRVDCMVVRKMKLREALAAAERAAREIEDKTEEFDTAEVAGSIAEICERALLLV